MNRILLFSRNDPGCPPDFTRTYSGGEGLCNQLMGLVRGIIETKKVLLVDSFLCSIVSGTITPVSTIIDLPETYKKVRPLKDILIVDRLPCPTIIEGKYGAQDKWRDVTSILLHHQSHFWDISSPRYKFNDLFGDPILGVAKKLVIKYLITTSDSSKGSEVVIEYAENDVNIYFTGEQWRELKTNFCWYNYYNTDLFVDVFNSIVFQSKFNDIVAELLAPYPEIVTSKISCIHYRNDPAAIDHWSRVNKMPQDIFTDMLNKKYAGLIDRYIAKSSSITLVLGSNDLSIASNKIWFSPQVKEQLTMKYLGVKGNEVSAIIDFLIGCKCNDTFVGCHNIAKATGSSFSYFLFRKLNGIRQRVMFDIDAVNEAETVFS